MPYLVSLSSCLALVARLKPRLNTDPVRPSARPFNIDGKLRKITWGGGLNAPFIDLGSGKAAVIDPATGAQSQNTDLPDGIPEIATLLKTMVATALAPAPATKVPPLKLDGLDIGDVSTDDLSPGGELSEAELAQIVDNAEGEYDEHEEGLGELQDLGAGGSKTAMGREETRTKRRVSPAPWDIAKFKTFLEAEVTYHPIAHRAFSAASPAGVNTSFRLVPG